MKKLLMIAALAMFATVACGSDDDDKTPVTPPTPAGAPEATIVATPASVAVAGKGVLNVTLNAAATKDVTVKVANADATIVTVGAELKVLKGATSASIPFTGVKEGSSKLSFTSADAKVKTADLTITVTKEAPKPLEYCEITFQDTAVPYASLGSFTLGTTKIEAGEGYMLYTGTAKLAAEFSVNFQPFSGTNVTGATDEYNIQIVADWNHDGDFSDAGESVWTKDIVAGAAAQDFKGTITIPADAAATSVIRVTSMFIKGDTSSSIENGCGHIESGTVIDVTYTK
ncbi:MAG: GEVED domain-containing protein [Rikenellaceae bacterium]